MNIFRTGVLFAGLTLVFLFCGFLIGGEAGMLITMVIAVGMNGFAYWNSDKIVLRMNGAREVNETSTGTLRYRAAIGDERRAADTPRLYN